MFLIDSRLAHLSLVLWRKCDVQKAVGRYFSWKKEVMFLYFRVHELTSKDWNLFLRYESPKCKYALNLAWHSPISDWSDVTAQSYRREPTAPLARRAETALPGLLPPDAPFAGGQTHGRSMRSHLPVSLQQSQSSLSESD